MNTQVKYIFILGGVLSGLGKGIVAASLGFLLKSRGLKVTIQKLDPYLNVDPGTMNPFQHGEVFVLDDGSETDLDLGHYERFIDENLTRKNTSTAGDVYWEVLQRERNGEYLGQTIQVIPHITDEIIHRIKSVNEDGKYDIIITEVGGTVGDIEGQPFYEALRQLCLKAGPQNSIVIHLTLLPYLKAAGELKTKPTQHSVGELRSIGIQPDIIVCRTEERNHLNTELKDKIALFCNVRSNMVFESPDVDSIYEIPLVMKSAHFGKAVLEHLNLFDKAHPHKHVERLTEFVEKFKNSSGTRLNIGIVAKYSQLKDSYKSIYESFIHASVATDSNVNVQMISSEDLEDAERYENLLEHVDGILIPGGFGRRGVEGKIRAVRFAREQKIPFFGICLGLQIAVVEYARNVCRLESANSTEFDEKTEHPLIYVIPGTEDVEEMGGTQRLGSYKCKLKAGSIAAKAYGSLEIHERHRHRYEVNNTYREQLESSGLNFTGLHEEMNLIEIVEIPDHPWFVGVQFHPELTSRILRPAPLFKSFVEAVKAYRESKDV